MAPEDTAASIDKPEPPDAAPKYLVEGFGKQDVETLRELADYAQQLAEWQAAQAATELEEQVTEVDGTPDEWDDVDWDDAVDEARERLISPLAREHSR